MPPLRLLLPLSCVVASVAFAQQPASRQGTGTVTGHVTAGDTQLPARFAHVTLFGVPKEVTPYKAPPQDQDEKAALAALTTALEGIEKTSLVNTQTDTNGDFIATDVAPGDYYLFATATGYVAPLSQVQALVDGGADLKRPLPGIQVVHVAADRGAQVSAVMTRGAAISGTVPWDDGSPVTGAVMTVQPATGGAPHPPQQFAMLAVSNVFGQLSVTDDLGHFRIAGLLPGQYVVVATVQSGGQSGIGNGGGLNKLASISPLVVFGPGAFHKKDAKPVTLAQGEDRRDQTITLNLGGMHTVSGRVSSMEDHHGLNAATVMLTDPNDPEFKRTAAVDALGEYTVHFVPPGSYTMAVSGAADTQPARGKAARGLFVIDKTLHKYQGAKHPVMVTDSNVTGQDFELTPAKVEPVADKAAGLAGGDFGADSN